MSHTVITCLSGLAFLQNVDLDLLDYQSNLVLCTLSVAGQSPSTLLKNVVN